MSVAVIGVGARVARGGEAVENGGKHETNDTAGIVRQLRDKLERYKQRQARQAGWIQRFIPTGLTQLDNALPRGGLPCGAITEISAAGSGVGTMSLAMRIASNSIKQTEGHASSSGVVENRRSIVLVDTFKDFYPPAACQQGIALDRLIVLRVSHARDALWAADQALRCSAVAAVISPFMQLDARCSRRLQLAAESSGCLGLILVPFPRRTKSFAAVQILIEGVAANRSLTVAARMRGMESKRALWTSSQGSAFSHVGAGDACLYRITLLKVREGMPVEPPPAGGRSPLSGFAA